MKQVVQNFKTGELKVEELPPPVLRTGGMLVRTAYSLISAGTERTTVATAQSSLIGKARQRPDLVKQVLDSVRREGLVNTYEKVMARLETVKALGYSAAGTVIEVGEGVSGFRVGDRVACAGVGYASHAEINFVPTNLCTLLPENISLAEAAYTTLGAIAMQGIRQAHVRLGENVVVIGLGLIGQLTIQMLKAAGCRILGIDLDQAVVDLAIKSGAHQAINRSEDVHKIVDAFTQGRGADSVILTASTNSNDPVKLAGEIARDRGRVVVVGAVKMDIPREHYYMKELELCLSRSYGPGRYDPDYEEYGQDYPIGYVRWTEKRNMEEFLRLVSEKYVNLDLLTTHRFAVEKASDAYDLILGKTGERCCGVLLEYPKDGKVISKIPTRYADKSSSSGQNDLAVGFIGAGNFATASLLPHLRNAKGVRLTGVANSTGVSSKNTAERFRFAFSSTDAKEVINDPNTNCVFIATRHSTHGELVKEALRKGRSVFVEKPLCLNQKELKDIIEAQKESEKAVLVGFNRRFSPLAIQLKQAFGLKNSPYSMIYRVNAGFIPKDNWIQDPLQGGGRIIGEVCHFIDLMQFFTDAQPIQVFAQSVKSGSDKETDEDSIMINISFSDGSIGTVHYLAIGDKSFPKERLEVFGAGSVAVLDDFKTATFTRNGNTSKFASAGQDKGHRNEVESFISSLQKNGAAPISMQSLVLTTLTTFCALESLRTGKPELVSLDF
ncbi:MAG: bi-domain-containing oxidoreductase [Acidobacteria bacterium]|nr:bi-domain-containing oxidoreductase [Acidobacteriota bacterium]